MGVQLVCQNNHPIHIGKVIKQQCEPYEYTIKETGEIIELSHKYVYVTEEDTQDHLNLEANKRELLDDNTSFDIYIDYKNGEEICGLGIEVKYTEKSYPFGKTEKERMWDDKSLYNQLSKNSGVYKKEALHKLRTTKLKQAWRNHLLGIKLLELKKLNKFYSVHLYPKANTYQANMCKEYIGCLKEEQQQSFIPITFEHFIETAEKVFTNFKHRKWIKYLKDRLWNRVVLQMRTFDFLNCAGIGSS